MNTGSKFAKLSVADYLSGEQDARQRHEYVEGSVYMMVGGTNAHNRIATNATVVLGGQLKGHPCQMFNSDTKVRIRTRTGTRFYYPDAMVACDVNPDHDVFQDAPVLLIEVLSPGTRRTDDTEKKDAYLSVDSLKVYLLVERSTAEARVYRRTESGFEVEHYAGLEAIIPLPEIDCQLAFAELYEDVRFEEEPESTEMK
ncbi:MAG: Uma2 family endonuclease [Planctomycetaceae bacterium]